MTNGIPCLTDLGLQGRFARLPPSRPQPVPPAPGPDINRLSFQKVTAVSLNILKGSEQITRF